MSSIGSPAGRGHDARRALAAAGEELACAHLVRLGLTIVARNHRTRFGELDVIACDASTLIFCEVKTRRDSAAGSPWDALGTRKQAQVRRIAGAYLAQEPGRPRLRDIRFDAIGVVIDARGRLVRLEHLEAAF